MGFLGRRVRASVWKAARKTYGNTVPSPSSNAELVTSAGRKRRARWALRKMMGW